MTLSVRNAESIVAGDNYVDSVDAGTTNPQATLVIYQNGGANPADVEAALGGATVLAQLDMSNPAFGAMGPATPSTAPSATANAITDDTAADATGTAHFFRILDRDNVAKIQGTVRASADPDNGEELVLNSKDIQINATVEITSFVATMPIT